MTLSEVSVTSFPKPQDNPSPASSLLFTVMRRINSITEKYLQRGNCSLPINQICLDGLILNIVWDFAVNLYAMKLTNLYSLGKRHIEIKNC